MNYEIHVAETENYSKRKRSALLLNATVSIGLFLIVSLLSNRAYGSFVGVLVFVIQFYKLNRLHRYFISTIKITGDNVSITYSDENEQRVLEGKLQEFIIKKELAFNKTKTPYLSIYYNGQCKIKQFEVLNWNEQKMNEVLADTYWDKQ